MPTRTLAKPLTLATLNEHMVHVEGGAFDMGSDEYSREQPIHRVTLHDFELCRYPVTQALWQEVTGENPSYFRGAQRPVESVSWADCQAFIGRLNARTGGGYRLPSEAEWEYAARGGRYGQGGAYAGGELLEELGWYDDNSLGETQPVGRKRPNELGLYDLSGNVWEWCQDHYHSSYAGAPADGSAWEDREASADRVSRGGSWVNDAGLCRVARRLSARPALRLLNVGLRLARLIDF